MEEGYLLLVRFSLKVPAASQNVKKTPRSTTPRLDMFQLVGGTIIPFPSYSLSLHIKEILYELNVDKPCELTAL